MYHLTSNRVIYLFHYMSSLADSAELNLIVFFFFFFFFCFFSFFFFFFFFFFFLFLQHKNTFTDKEILQKERNVLLLLVLTCINSFFL